MADADNIEAPETSSSTVYCKNVFIINFGERIFRKSLENIPKGNSIFMGFYAIFVKMLTIYVRSFDDFLLTVVKRKHDNLKMLQCLY